MFVDMVDTESEELETDEDRCLACLPFFAAEVSLATSTLAVRAFGGVSCAS